MKVRSHILPIVIGLLILTARQSPGQQVNHQPRTKTSINGGWQFTFEKSDADSWENVHLPHTWNNRDAFDEEPGYRRTVAWYKKELTFNPHFNKKYVLKFEAVNQIAEVYINGELAKTHKGGYTAFTVDATPYLNQNVGNELVLKVDNRHNNNIPPLKGDFNFYGGIYRDVWLIELNQTHFSFGDYASSGVFVTTPKVSTSSATLQVRGYIDNKDGKDEKLNIVNRLIDPNGQTVATREQAVPAEADSISFQETFATIENPKLWHPDHPHLYTLESQIRNLDGKVLDELNTSVGFRWFRFDADKGFFLNGESLKLKGVNRHQDYKGQGNALSNARHLADMKLARQTGSNFLRTAHYPQDPAILEAADRLGLLVSMEIPLDHEITDSKAFYKNTIAMQRAMIRQYYNHPSIIIWAYMNEMLLGRDWHKDQNQINKIVDFAKELEQVTRREDATRYTMIPNHGAFELYQKSGLTEIPMIVGWNLYFGWYESELDGLGDFLDQHHRELPNKPTIVTEYGAGSDLRIRTQNPLRFDFSIEWQNRFMQQNLQQIMERDFVAGSAVWNLFDFGSANRRDAVPTINSKGLMTFDRRSKDAYHLLTSWFSDKPVVRIGSKSWEKRAGKADTGGSNTSTQRVQLYGNVDKAELFLNGESIGTKAFTNHIAEWQVPFRGGRNVLRVESVSDKTVQDVAEIDFELHTADQFHDVYINAGSNFYFMDKENGIVWHPDTEYENGFWGYSGGDNYRPRSRGIGTPVDILGTDRDPLFQTQRQGMDSYHFDAPQGTYELVLLFAHLDDNADSVRQSSAFNIAINGSTVVQNMSLKQQYGSKRAVQKKVIFYNQEDDIKIDFEPDTVQPVINGIGIRKIK